MKIDVKKLFCRRNIIIASAVVVLGVFLALLFTASFAIFFTDLNGSALIYATEITPANRRATPFDAIRRRSDGNSGRLVFGGYCYDGVNFGDAVHVGFARDAMLDFVVSYEVTEQFLDNAYAGGLGVVASGYNRVHAWLNFTDEHLNGWLSLKPSDYKAHPALWGDNIADEPSGHSFPKISEAIRYYDTIQKYPFVPSMNTMPFVNMNAMTMSIEEGGFKHRASLAKQMFLPFTDFSDRRIDSYKQYVAELLKYMDTDYISTDIYPLLEKGESHVVTQYWLRCLDALAEVARDTGRDLWVITQSAGGGQRGDGKKSKRRFADTLPDQLQQGYVALAFGARALINGPYQGGWWDNNSHPIDAKGERTATYYAVQEANRQFALLRDVWADYTYRGTYIENKAKAFGLAGPNYDLYNGLAKEEHLSMTTRDPLLIGCFSKKDGEGKSYVITNMNNNLNNKSASATIDFPQNAQVTIYTDGQRQTFGGGKRTINLTKGNGCFIEVKTV